MENSTCKSNYYTLIREAFAPKNNLDFFITLNSYNYTLNRLSKLIIEDIYNNLDEVDKMLKLHNIKYPDYQI